MEGAEVLSGKRVLVTGASGLIGAPLARHLAAANDVYALARFSDPAARHELARAGAEPLTVDLATTDPRELPDVDYVFHAGATLPSKGAERSRPHTFEVNVQATGRLLRRYAGVEGFVHCSSGSVYAYQGQRPLREDDPYGLHNNIPTYSASKIAAESLVEFLAREQRTPTTIVRIFTVYGPAGGTVTARIDLVARGEPVPVFPGGPNQQTPMFIDDAVEKAEVALTLGQVPPLVVNFAGSETASVQEYTAIAGRLLGKEVAHRESADAYYPIWADVTKMHQYLGPCRTSVAEGVRQVVESARLRRERGVVPG
jgi:nucleoside-diphosphate-sugar epimerase